MLTYHEWFLHQCFFSLQLCYELPEKVQFSLEVPEVAVMKFKLLCISVAVPGCRVSVGIKS